MESKDEFQEKINYQFKNEKLLEQALTHSSYANEKRMHKRYNNERLEFLGDAVLELLTSDFLYHKYPNYPEGELTRVRASLVCEQTLTYCAKKLELGPFLLLGKGEEMTGGRKRKSILSDAMEAIIGAIYLDGGFTSAKEFVDNFILKDVEQMQLFFDSKTILQEVVQSNFEGTLDYRLINETGPDHNKNFLVEACIGKKTVGQGEGSTKKSAEQVAAYHALIYLQESGGINVFKKY